MADSNPTDTEPTRSLADRLVYWLGLTLVIVGLMNVTPSTPG